MKTKTVYTKLNRKDIDKYASVTSTGSVTEDSMDSFDEFDHDAFDGWKESGLSTSEMKRLDKKFGFRTSFKNLLNIGLGIFGIVLISIFIVRNQTADKQVTTLNDVIKNDKSLSMLVDKTDLNLPESIDTLIELPVKQQITASTIKKAQQEIGEQKSTEKTPVLVDIPIERLEVLPTEIKTNPVELSQQKTAKELIVNGLKVIDYSSYRNNPSISIEQIILTGTTADREKQGDEVAQFEQITLEIPYSDYLRKTMGNVNKGKWKDALQRFEIILETYPEDVNAHFYSGLCNYNLQQYNEAKNHFSTCLQLKFNNFNEEASWYLAKSLLANKEKKEAKELFEVIQQQGGFYSKQAKLIMNKEL